MNCPKCDNSTLTIDSRKVAHTIRRRRSCSGCGHRFTTYEEEARLNDGQVENEVAAARRELAELKQLLSKRLKHIESELVTLAKKWDKRRVVGG